MRARGRWTGLLPLTFVAACTLAASARAAEIHVAPMGRDDGGGTAAAPLRSLAAAQGAARKVAGREPVTVVLRGGVYYLPDTLVFTAGDSGTKENPVTYAAAPGEPVVLSGGVRLD